MIASLVAIRPGHVRGCMSVNTLRGLLNGDQSFEDALTGGGTRPPRYIPCSQMAPRTLVGFVLQPDRPREIVAVRLPFTRQMVPAVTSRPTTKDWDLTHQLLCKDFLLRHEAVVIAADWLDYSLDLAGTLEQEAVRVSGIDKTLRTIGQAWERWERGKMTWADRAKDLARLTGLKEMTPNHLQVTCKRHGLIRRDKKAVSVIEVNY